MTTTVLIGTSDGCKYGCIVDVNRCGEVEVLETKPHTIITSEIRRLAEEAVCDSQREARADKADRMLDARESYKECA